MADDDTRPPTMFPESVIARIREIADSHPEIPVEIGGGLADMMTATETCRHARSSMPRPARQPVLPASRPRRSTTYIHRRNRKLADSVSSTAEPFCAMDRFCSLLVL